MLATEIVALIEAQAPRGLAEPWDNVGLQVGNDDMETETCLLTVDVTRQSVREAKAVGASLIVAHHPLILRPLSALTAAGPVGQTVLAAARAMVSVYVAHTNLDASVAIGTSAALADQLGIARGPALAPAQAQGPGDVLVGLVGPPPRIDGALSAAGLADAGFWQWQAQTNAEEGKVVLKRELTLPSPTAERLVEAAHGAGLGVSTGRVPEAGPVNGIGMLCEVPEMRLDALAGYVERKLSTRQCATVGDPEQSIKRVALVPGSGGEMIGAAAAVADAMVTGEVKYHDAQLAAELGLCVICAGHYQTERPVLNLLARYLREASRGRLQPAISQENTDPFGASDTLAG